MSFPLNLPPLPLLPDLLPGCSNRVLIEPVHRGAFLQQRQGVGTIGGHPAAVLGVAAVLALRFAKIREIEVAEHRVAVAGESADAVPVHVLHELVLDADLVDHPTEGGVGQLADHLRRRLASLLTGQLLLLADWRRSCLSLEARLTLLKARLQLAAGAAISLGVVELPRPVSERAIPLRDGAVVAHAPALEVAAGDAVSEPSGSVRTLRRQRKRPAPSAAGAAPARCDAGPLAGARRVSAPA